jgi:hypothetical protein
MITTQDKHGEYPLILAAKWVLKNFVPEKLILKMNKNHPQANIFIPKKSEDGTPIFDGEINKLNVTEILAKDFRDNEYVINSTVKGEVALFHVNYADGSKDKLISKEDFNSNYTIISY